MGARYEAVQWNKNKKVYDFFLIAAIVVYLTAFIISGALTRAGDQAISPAILLIRAFGSCAFILLTLILMIGPLARLSSFFLPILYNRRHLGVATFVIALIHAIIVVFWYHGFGELNPFVSVLISNDRFDSVSQFPFEVFGVVALTILFLMAATSHDFWLANLSARTWKNLHMLVYIAYAALALHVGLGFLQSEQASFYTVLVYSSVGTVIAMHLITGFREWRRDGKSIWIGKGGADWVYVANVKELRDGRAKVVGLGTGEKVAIWRNDNKISATSNVCAHQGGPLGEGRIIDDCITCPWHGFQYDPANGRSPPPYTEKIETFELRLEEDALFIDPKPRAPGTPVDPLVIKEN